MVGDRTEYFEYIKQYIFNTTNCYLFFIGMPILILCMMQKNTVLHPVTEFIPLKRILFRRKEFSSPVRVAKVRVVSPGCCPPYWLILTDVDNNNDCCAVPCILAHPASHTDLTGISKTILIFHEFSKKSHVMCLTNYSKQLKDKKKSLSFILTFCFYNT